MRTSPELSRTIPRHTSDTKSTQKDSQMTTATVEPKALHRQQQQSDLNGNRWTPAPLHMAGEFVFHTPPEEVFEKLTDPKVIASWFPIVYDGTTDHGQSCNVDNWGEGTKRYCYTRGMGTLDETILHWDAPNSYAYSIKNWMMPIKDHVGIMRVEEMSPGKSVFRWDQYFNLTGLVTRHVFPRVMIGLMNRGMANLARDLGGPGGKMKAV